MKRIMCTVKIGSKGQIVIPKDVRELFGLESGDRLVLFADTEKGIALDRYEKYEKLAESVLGSDKEEMLEEEKE